MRKLVLVAVFSAVALVSSAIVEAAQRQPAGGNVPSSMLAEMGLEGMEVISDDAGQEVRGSGFFFHHGFFFYPSYYHPFLFHRIHPFFFHHHHGHHHHHTHVPPGLW